MDKEDVEHVYVEYYSAVKIEIMPFAATRMDLQIVKLSEVSEGQLSFGTVNMWDLKKKAHSTNELIYKTEIELQLVENKLTGCWGWGEGEG